MFLISKILTPYMNYIFIWPHPVFKALQPNIVFTMTISHNSLTRQFSYELIWKEKDHQLINWFYKVLFLSQHVGYNCPNNKSVCIPDAWTCDGNDDCKAGDDHIGDESLVFCNSLCPWGQVRCPGLCCFCCCYRHFVGKYP